MPFHRSDRAIDDRPWRPTLRRDSCRIRDSSMCTPTRDFRSERRHTGWDVAGATCGWAELTVQPPRNENQLAKQTNRNQTHAHTIAHNAPIICRLPYSPLSSSLVVCPLPPSLSALLKRSASSLRMRDSKRCSQINNSMRTVREQHTTHSVYRRATVDSLMYDVLTHFRFASPSSSFVPNRQGRCLGS